MVEAPLRKFLSDAEHNTRTTVHLGVPMIANVEEVDAVFGSLREVTAPAEHVLFPVFADRSRCALRAAVRILFGGQVPESYPLIRLALENALYAFHTSTDAVALAWARRGMSAQDTRRVREDFQISRICDKLTKQDPELGKEARRLYDLAIEWGAHPNVLGHACTSQWDDSGVHIDLLAPDTPLWMVSVQRLVRTGVVCLRILRAARQSKFSDDAHLRLSKLDSLTGSWKEFRKNT